MTFKESVKACLKVKYAKFSGRASRSEYWWFALFVNIAPWIFIGVLGLLNWIGEEYHIVPLVVFANISLCIGLLVFYIGTLVPCLAVTVRRLHDCEKSGWFILIGLIPVLGSLLLLWYLIKPGDYCENNYGLIPE